MTHHGVDTADGLSPQLGPLGRSDQARQSYYLRHGMRAPLKALDLRADELAENRRRLRARSRGSVGRGGQPCWAAEQPEDLSHHRDAGPSPAPSWRVPCCGSRTFTSTNRTPASCWRGSHAHLPEGHRYAVTSARRAFGTAFVARAARRRRRCCLMSCWKSTYELAVMRPRRRQTDPQCQHADLPISVPCMACRTDQQDRRFRGRFSGLP